jgi:hypothetical protein
MDPLLVGIIVLVLLGLALIGYMVIQGHRGGSRAVSERVRGMQDTGQQFAAPVETEPPSSHLSLPTVEGCTASL